MNKLIKPNAGSQEAQDNGCICPVLDNNYGKGYYNQGDVFIYNLECEIHGDIKNNNNEKDKNII